MNNMRFDGYGYPDMPLLNNMFMPSINNDNVINNYDTRNTTNQNVAKAYEGYIKGNLFNDLYQEYKNYQPKKLIPNNEQAELLLNVNQTTFAAHEIKLYLDINPNDTSMINLYNQYQKQASEAVKAYEKKYGPILADSPSQTNTFSWEAYSWPWEKEEM
jgi:spore coat protein JB